MHGGRCSARRLMLPIGALPTEKPTETGMRPLRAGRQAEQIARRLGDPSLLAFAFNGIFMQSFQRAGLAQRRDAVGAEILTVTANNQLATYEVLGHLICLQARCALSDPTGADRHADAANALAARHQLPLVTVFTEWYRALHTSMSSDLTTGEAAYERAAVRLAGAKPSGSVMRWATSSVREWPVTCSTTMPTMR